MERKSTGASPEFWPTQHLLWAEMGARRCLLLILLCWCKWIEKPEAVGYTLVAHFVILPEPFDWFHTCFLKRENTKWFYEIKRKQTERLPGNDNKLPGMSTAPCEDLEQHLSVILRAQVRFGISTWLQIHLRNRSYLFCDMRWHWRAQRFIWEKKLTWTKRGRGAVSTVKSSKWTGSLWYFYITF